MGRRQRCGEVEARFSDARYADAAERLAEVADHCDQTPVDEAGFELRPGLRGHDDSPARARPGGAVVARERERPVRVPGAAFDRDQREPRILRAELPCDPVEIRATAASVRANG